MVQVLRKCEICGNEYTVDVEDKVPLCHTCYLKKYSGEGWYVFLTTGSGCIEILAPVDKIRAVAQSGNNSQAVEELCSIPIVRKQLNQYSDKLIIEEASYYITDEELTRDKAEQYLMWSLCWDFVDSGEVIKTKDYLDHDYAIRYAFVLDLVEKVTLSVGTEKEETLKVIEYNSLVGKDYVILEGDKQIPMPELLEGLEDGTCEITWKN